MSDEFDALPPAMRALIDAGAEGPPAPARVKDRLLQRVEATVRTRGLDRVEEDAPARAANDVASHDESWGAPPDSRSYVASAVVGYATRARLRAARYPLLAAVFAIGLITGGFVVYAVVRPATSSQVAHAPPAASASASASASGPEQTPDLRPATGTAPWLPPSASPSDPIGAPAASGTGAAHVEPEARGSAAPENRDSAAAERALVETARAALARQDGQQALSVLGRHAREFPNGSFAEEREALAIQALVKTGDVASAKTRGERFRQHYPRSLFLPVVNEATRGL